MNNLQFNIFDFFGNVIPGLIILLFSNLLIAKSQFTLESLFELSQTLTIKNSLLAFLMGYVVGFACQHISYKIFKTIVKTFIDTDLSLTSKGELLSRIRHESPNNSVVINRFLALRILGYNMFFASIVSILCFLLSLLYSMQFYTWVNYLFIPIAFIIGILFLLRAIDFLKYAHSIIDDTKKLL